MKKIITLALASFVMFACSKNEPAGNDGQKGGVVFNLKASNTLSINSKVPLFSQDTVPTIDQVIIYAYLIDGTDTTFVTSYDTGWTADTRAMTYTIASPLDDGEYRFLIVGSLSTSDYTIPTPAADDPISDMIASVSTLDQVGELFTANVDKTIAGAGTRVDATLTRPVAGILGYFKNVPAEVGGVTVATLRLIITGPASAMSLAYSSPTAMGTTYDIMNIDLTGQSVTADGVYEGNLADNQAINPAVAQLEDSQLGGMYLLPTGLTTVSISLGLYDAGGTSLKSWTVQSGGSATFVIAPNNFYSLGKKYLTEVTNGPDGDDTDDDDDVAIDLLTDQELNLTLDTNWTTVNDLTIQ